MAHGNSFLAHLLELNPTTGEINPNQLPYASSANAGDVIEFDGAGSAQLDRRVEHVDATVRDTEQTTSVLIPTDATYLSLNVDGGASLPAGTYRIAWDVSVRHDATNSDWAYLVEITTGTPQVLTNQNASGYEAEQPSNSGTNQSAPRSGSKTIEWPGGQMNIRIGISNQTSGSSTFRRGHITVDRLL